MGHALAHNVFGGFAVNAFTAQQHVALGFEHAAHGTQCGGFACTVGAQDGGDAAVAHIKVQAVQHLGVAILGVKATHFQQVVSGAGAGGASVAHASTPK
jgi:hypothetical protein